MIFFSESVEQPGVAVSSSTGSAGWEYDWGRGLRPVGVGDAGQLGPVRRRDLIVTIMVGRGSGGGAVCVGGYVL